MKKFILLSLLLIASCSKNQNQEQPSITSPKEGSADIIKKDLFDCDSNKCFQSVVAVTSNDKICTGVVDNGLILTNTNCLKALDLSNISIFDIYSNKFIISSTKPYSEDNLITAIQTTEDISELNSNIAILDKENLGVNSVRIDLLNEKFIQEKMDCSITLNSINALNATKINSQTLAIKDCDNLREDSIILQNEELVSLVTTSDVLNLSKSIACGQDCDDSYEDKLAFIITELKNKTKIKQSLGVRIHNFGNYNSSYRTALIGNELQIIQKIACFRFTSKLSGVIASTQSVYSEYGELISSKPIMGKKEHYHLVDHIGYDNNLIPIKDREDFFDISHISSSIFSLKPRITQYEDSTFYQFNIYSTDNVSESSVLIGTTYIKSCSDLNSYVLKMLKNQL